MWLFTSNGHLSLSRNPYDLDELTVRSQSREDMERFVVLLDRIGEGRHEVQEIAEEGYLVMVTAKKAVVARAVARIVGGIDYQRFVHSTHFDFGEKPGFLLWTTPTGLQVARVIPD
jgi:hypothetical protein